MKPFLTFLALIFLLNAFGQRPIHGNSKSAYLKQWLNVKVRLSDESILDTLQLEYYIPPNSIPNQVIFSSLKKNGFFTFRIPLNSTYGYFQISNRNLRSKQSNDQTGSPVHLTPLLYCKAGDDIFLNLTKDKNNQQYPYSIQACGKAVRKYQLALAADSILYRSPYGPDSKEIGSLSNSFRIRKTINYLNANRNCISKTDIETLKANCLFDEPAFQGIAEDTYILLSHNKELDANKYALGFKNFQKKYIAQASSVGLARSVSFPRYAILEAETEYVIKHREKYLSHWAPYTKITLDSILPMIIAKYSGPVRDHIIAHLLFFDLKTVNTKKMQEKALSIISDKQNFKQLKKLLNSRTEKSLAYNYYLPDTNGVYHSLKDLRGKVVFQDFYYVGCGGCAGLYQNVLKDVEEHYKNNSNVVFVSIDADPSVQRVKLGIKEGVYNSSISLNLYTNGKGFSHDMLKYYSVMSYPYVLIVDRSGNIAQCNTDDIKTKDGLIKQIDRLLME